MGRLLTRLLDAVDRALRAAFIVGLLSVPFVLLYVIVRFVKWTWSE